ncbi:MAG: hypothetical protein KDA73_02745 [Rhodobacteraceae bacterium]|nr:hypothetical protein [Paracoccaceae bacterium]
MRRRRFLAGIGAMAAAAGSGSPLSAARGCHRLEGSAVICTVGFAQTPEIPPEPCRANCWAACLSYLMRAAGARVDTGNILARQGMPDGCRPGDDFALLRGTSGGWSDRSGRRFRVDVAELAPIIGQAPDDPALSGLLDGLARRPVLCGAAGHTTVLTQITTLDDPVTGFRREQVLVRDPFVATHGLRRLSDAELAESSYALAVTIRRI